MALTATIASVLSGLPMTVLLTSGGDPDYILSAATVYMGLAFAGSFLIGLPVALLVYRLARDFQDFGLWHLAGLANAIALCVGLVLFTGGGAFGVIFLGIPILLAANAFAIAGWFLVFKPERAGV
ncbi:MULTISPECIES: hypothetical protein [unclassified Novosphingobium]|uniref:hypothetical protein n=1 Tax=unclassified Novosphingobium TaxID=2644732 RepID=UPI0025FB99B5|nr:MULTISPECIES: hypothetical protein [unclassified Novosphingobium]HQV02727.1 hypothetical protein [Novosphingobium sp.]